MKGELKYTSKIFCVLKKKYFIKVIKTYKIYIFIIIKYSNKLC